MKKKEMKRSKKKKEDEKKNQLMDLIAHDVFAQNQSVSAWVRLIYYEAAIQKIFHKWQDSELFPLH